MIRSSVVLLLVLLGNFSGFAQGRGGENAAPLLRLLAPPERRLPLT